MQQTRRAVILGSLFASLFLVPSLGHAQFTLGTVQSQITQGMDQSEVAVVLGAPNMVTQDAKGNETWIYDKISTTVAESAQSHGNRQQQGTAASGGVGLGIGIGKSLLGLGGDASQSQSQSQSHFAQQRSGVTTQSSKTLTVIIKFDADKRVSKVRFNQSAF